MGRMIEEIALSRGHEIVSIIDIDNQADFDSPAFKSADVAIEFTAPHVAYENYLKAFRHHVKVVSGSTGWMDKHGEDVRRMCAEEGQTLFWSSNFSLGVAVFRAVSRHLAQIMNRYDDYKPVMEEVHHDVTVVQDDPAAVIAALGAADGNAQLGHAVVHVVSQGLDLVGVAAGGDDHVVTDDGQLPHVQGEDVVGLVLVQGLGNVLSDGDISHNTLLAVGMVPIFVFLMCFEPGPSIHFNTAEASAAR